MGNGREHRSGTDARGHLARGGLRGTKKSATLARQTPSDKTQYRIFVIFL